MKRLRQHYNDEQPLHLIIDVYSCHRTELAKQMAASLNITLHYIPVGCTDEYQPLDRRVFGCLKATGKSHIHKILSEEHGSKIGMIRSIRIIIWAWEHLTTETILNAWNIYGEDW